MGTYKNILVHNTTMNYGLHDRPFERTTGQIIKKIPEDKKEEDTIAVILDKNILVWFVKVLLKHVKCPLVDIHTKFDSVNQQRGAFYERI